MSSFTIYLLFLIGNINIGFNVLFGITLVAAIVFTVCYGIFRGDLCEDEKEDYSKMGKKWRNIFIIILGISFGCMCFLPSTEQLAVIYLLPKLSKSKVVKTLPTYAQTFLDLEIKKLKKEALNETK